MRRFPIFFTLILVLMISIPSAFAQNYTQWGVPEGALMRLGKGTIHEIKYSPDGTRLAVASRIGVWIYDTQTGEELDLFIGHTDTINSISFSPDGKTLASGSSDNTIRLWDVETDRTPRIFTRRDTYSVNSVAFSPNGKTLASGSSNGTIRLWDTESGKHLSTLTGHRSGVYSISFSPDGGTLASGSLDNTIRLWDVETGRTLHTLTGHTDGVNGVAFSPDGGTLATGSWDSTVLLWQLTAAMPEPEKRPEDINKDGIINISDLVFGISRFGLKKDFENEF